MVEGCNNDTDVAFLNLKMMLGKDFYNLEYTDLYVIRLDWGVYLVLNSKMEFLMISGILDRYNSCVVLNSDIIDLEHIVSEEVLKCLKYYTPGSDDTTLVVDKDTGDLIAKCKDKSIVQDSMYGADSIISINWTEIYDIKWHYKSREILYDTVAHQIKKEYKAVLQPYKHNRSIICLTDKVTTDGKYVWEHLELERKPSATRVYKHFKLVETLELEIDTVSELRKQLTIQRTSKFINVITTEASGGTIYHG